MIINGAATAQIKNLLVNSYDNIVKLNFETASPSLTYTGINHGFEAVSHAEDGLGNILFFVNADGVYNAHNVLMPGSGKIYANSSATEIDICPFPDNPNKFYIFYNAELCSSLYYSVVDMKLDHGLGDVVSLNTEIDSANVSEGLEVIKRPCRNSYWLLAYVCDIGFKRYLIDEKGVSEGTIIYDYSGPEIFVGRGELDYNNGRMGMSFANSPISTAFVCDFDASSGIITNPKTIILPDGGQGLYGMEFSPDGSKAYMSNWYENKKDNLFQYDFATEKINSFFITSTPADKIEAVTGPGQIELGTDGKLYIPFDKGNQITVVSNPNSLTPEFSKITTTSKLALGVSDHIQSEMYKTQNNFTFSHVCLGETTNFISKASECSDHLPKVIWNFGDNASGKKNTSTALSPSHYYASAGDYKVNLYLTDSIGTDTISHIVSISAHPKVNLGNDTSICKGMTIVLNPHTAASSFSWSTSEYQPKIKVYDAGKYWVNAANKGCSSSDTILIKARPLPVVNIGPDLYLCDSLPQTLDAGPDFKSYIWSTGEKTQSINAPGIKYWVSVSNGLCWASDSIEITYQAVPKVYLGKDIILCGNDSAVLNAGNIGAEFLWSTGDTSRIIKVNRTGTYYVTANNGLCTFSDTVNVINRGFIPVIKVPNKFKIDSSNVNPSLKIITENLKYFHIKILNTAGKLVYESLDLAKGWNGKTLDSKKAADGIYHYTIEYNTPCKDEKEIKKGVFTLAREVIENQKK